MPISGRLEKPEKAGLSVTHCHAKGFVYENAAPKLVSSAGGIWHTKRNQHEHLHAFCRKWCVVRVIQSHWFLLLAAMVC